MTKARPSFRLLAGGGAGRPAGRPRLLLAGPLPHPRDVIGGTKVSFADLVQRLASRPGFEVEVLDTARPRAGLSRLRRLVEDARALARLCLRLARRPSDGERCLWCVSAGGVLRAGPLVWLLCRLRGRPLAVRPFGGDLDVALARAPAPLRALARRTVLRAPLLLLQTHALCERFPGARWLPTAREIEPRAPLVDPDPARGARRFVLLGQLRPEKGVLEALQASDGLPPDAELCVYGPPMPGFDARQLAGHPRARWCGPLASAEVPPVLRASDVLLLPSYHQGEGIPGAIVEALQCGVPVIATRWRSLPEIVEHEKNGLLVEPKDAQALGQAMQRLVADGRLWRALAAGARASGELWRSTRWVGALEGWLLALDERRAA